MTNRHSELENGYLIIVDLPNLKNGDVPVRYVS